MKNPITALVVRSLLIVAFVFAWGSASAQADPRLEKLAHSVLSTSSEQVVLQLNGPYSPKIFTLKGETPRVILDFPDMVHSREIKGITTTKGTLVKRVRVGMHTEGTPKTRVVFDVATLDGLNYTQQFDPKTSTLTIRFTGTEKKAEIKKTTAAKERPATASNAMTVTEEKSAPSTENVQAVPAPPVAPAAQEGAASPQIEEKTAALPAPLPPAPATVTQTETAPQAPSTPPAPPAAKGSAPSPAPATKPAPQAAAETKPAKMEETVKPAPPQPAPTTTETLAKPGPPVQEPAPAAAQAPSAAKSEPAPPVQQTKPEPPAAVAAVDPSPRLESVKFDATSPKGEMVLFKLNGFHPPAVHGVEEGIPRVICDFNNTKLIETGKNLIKTDGKHVKGIRISTTKKPEKVRVVIDLEPNRSYDLQQVFFKEDNLFVIIVNTVKK